MRKHAKKSQESKKIPKWLAGQNKINELSSLNQNQSRKLQHDRNSLRSHGGARRVRRVIGNQKTTGGPGTFDNRRTESRTNAGLENGTEYQTTTSSTRTIKITLLELHQNLSQKDLQALLDENFEPNKVITIERIVTSPIVSEDQYISMPQPIRNRKIKKKKIIQPSEKFEKEFTKHKLGELETNAKVILAYYFKLYFKLFQEEDPDWINSNMMKAIHMIERFTDDVSQNNYEPVLYYLRKIMPLWQQRLLNDADFPNTRPSLSLLFGGKKHFWANRNLYYKKWQRK